MEQPNVTPELTPQSPETRSLKAIEADINALPYGIRPAEFRRRLRALQAEWTAANLAAFDLQVAMLDAMLPEEFRSCE